MITKVQPDQVEIRLDRSITDILRVLSCVMVALSHYCGYAVANGVSSSIIYKAIAANGGYIGVAIFFFLSGYGLTRSEQKKSLTLGCFLKKRLSKVYIPTVLVSCLWLMTAMITGRDLLCNHKYLLGVIWRFNDEVLWFIQVIIILYIFFFVYSLIRRRYGHRLCFLIISTVLAYCVVRFSGIGSSLSVPLFFAGIAVADIPFIFRRFFRSFWGITLFVVLIGILAFVFRHDNYCMHGLINYAVVGSLIALSCTFNINILSLPIFVRFLNDIALDIYLVHWKIHLLMITYLGVDKLWLFILGTAVASYLLKKIRQFSFRVVEIKGLIIKL